MPPAIKISLYAVLVIMLYLVKNLSLHAAIALMVCTLLFFLLPLRKAAGGLVPIALFLLFTFVANLFSPSGRILYSAASVSITDEGLQLAALRTVRLVSMIGGAKILSAVLPFDEMVKTLETLFRPLEKLKVPVSDFFATMGLTVKAFPLLTRHVVNAYKEDAENKGLQGYRSRMRHLVSFLLPVFVKTIQSPESFFVSTGSAEVEREWEKK